jgi:predicted nucleic acid-binding protein
VKDDKFLATAYTAKADYLVTEDNDLLVLEEYKGIKIITAENFLEILERRST